jgi:hypothetical protein
MSEYGDENQDNDWFDQGSDDMEYEDSHCNYDDEDINKKVKSTYERQPIT